jgi:hypothetical protein
MRILGHKRLQNTIVYTQMVQFKKEEYTSATANTIEDAQKLVESGFEYVTEIDGVKLFRKRSEQTFPLFNDCLVFAFLEVD